MKLVVGLGNPGAEYRDTRHNVGFQVIDELARRWGVQQWRESFESLAAKSVRGDEPVLLCKPLTFMNLSGRAVVGLAGYFKVETPDLLVVTLSGVVTSRDQVAVVAQVRKAIREVGPIRLLFLLEDFSGWHLAAFNDRSLWLRDDEGVTRIAIVGEPERRMDVLTAVAQPLRLIPIEWREAAKPWRVAACSKERSMAVSTRLGSVTSTTVPHSSHTR